VRICADGTKLLVHLISLLVFSMDVIVTGCSPSDETRRMSYSHTKQTCTLRDTEHLT
jgi:hypothetical protein